MYLFRLWRNVAWVCRGAGKNGAKNKIVSLVFGTVYGRFHIILLVRFYAPRLCVKTQGLP